VREAAFQAGVRPSPVAYGLGVRPDAFQPGVRPPAAGVRPPAAYGLAVRGVFMARGGPIAGPCLRSSGINLPSGLAVHEHARTTAIAEKDLRPFVYL